MSISNRKPQTLLFSILLVAATSCSTLPSPKFIRHKFPKEAFVGDVKRPYEKMGLVKTRVDFTTLDPGREEDDLCRNYFNKAVTDLVARAKKKGAQAVIDVRSVVFLEDGRQETYPTPECSDDGGEGQILAEGIAVKWKPRDPKTINPDSPESFQEAADEAEAKPPKRVKIPKVPTDSRRNSPFYSPAASGSALKKNAGSQEKIKGWVPESEAKGMESLDKN